MMKSKQETILRDFNGYLSTSKYGGDSRSHFLRELERLLESIEKGTPYSERNLNAFFGKFPDFSTDALSNNSSNDKIIPPEPQLLAIVCALHEPEASEVVKLLNSNTELTTKNGIRFVHGQFKYEKNRSINVAIFFQSQMGPVDAASVTTHVLTELNPAYLVMTGVCGGRENTKIGDVLVASKAITYQSGEYKDDTFIHEPRVSLSTESFIRLTKQHANNIQQKISYRSTTDALSSPSIRVGTMLCGDAIVNAQGMIEDLTNRLDRRVVGVDMESYGVLRACEVHGKENMQVLVAKGVMDICEGREEQRDKVAAAYASAIFIFELFDIVTKQTLETASTISKD